MAHRGSGARRLRRLFPGERRAGVDADRRHRIERAGAGALMLEALRIPITWNDLLKRTWAEVQADNCLGLAAQLAYYFFLALFPALLFLVALASYFPIANLMDQITAMLARVAPYEALKLIQDQLIKISQDKNGGVLTPGMIGAIWSTPSGATAAVDTPQQAYRIQESRARWK